MKRITINGDGHGFDINYFDYCDYSYGGPYYASITGDGCGSCKYWCDFFDDDHSDGDGFGDGGSDGDGCGIGCMVAPSDF